MAGGKLSARQKMIGMMYLVLTALLALNVSKEIVKAFLLVNDGLERTVTNYDHKNSMIYADLDKRKSLDPKRVASIWERAQKVKATSNDAITYIEELKQLLIAETAGIPYPCDSVLTLEHTESVDNYDIPTYIMVEDTDDGSKGKAKELKQMLQGMTASLLSVLDEEDRSQMNLEMDLADVQTEEGTQTWEINNFYHTPLAASVALLSKLESDVRNMEYEVLNKLTAELNEDILPFDTVTSKVLASSNYVLQGQAFEADVLLAAFSKTLKPEIMLGELDEEGNLTNVYDTLDVTAGLGKISIPATAQGQHQVQGAIKLQKQDGSVKWFPFEQNYLVAKPALVVSPLDMNILYMGPDMKMDISVPGVPSENLMVSISGSGNTIRKSTDGKYICKLSRTSPRNVAIKCSVKNKDGSVTPIGSINYKAKKLPKPKAKIGRAESGDLAKLRAAEVRGLRKLRGLYASSFMFSLPLTVVKFDVEHKKSSSQFIDEYKNIRGNSLNTGRLAQVIPRVRKGDILWITNIKVKDVAGNIHTAKTITIQVK